MKKSLAQLQRSWLAANVAGWNGACVALTAVLGNGAGHILGSWLDFNVAIVSFKQFASFFAGAFLWSFVRYFADHPIRLEAEIPNLKSQI